MGQKEVYTYTIVREQEIQLIVDYLQAHSITEAAKHFGFNRKTIYRIKISSGVHPPRYHGSGLSMEELDQKWKEQDKCFHQHYTMRCSHCQKILGSDKLPLSTE
jgi:hypothetical protein